MRSVLCTARASRWIAAALSAVLATHTARACPQDPDGWDAASSQLEALVSGRIVPPAERAAANEAVASWSRAHPESFESRLAAIHLARLAGRADAILEPDRVPAEMSARDAWLAALVLPSGPARAHAFALAIAGASSADLLERLGRAFPAFLEEAEALRLEAAEELAMAMYAAQPASWSSTTLGVLWTRMGKYAEAERVLSAEIARLDAGVEEAERKAAGSTDETARAQALGAARALRDERRAMYERRAVSRRGAGRDAQALDDLGRALAEGGRDAAQMLGQNALASGDLETARALFRTLLEPREGETPESLEEAAPWALRGWGLALLTPRAAPASTSKGARAVGHRNH